MASTGPRNAREGRTLRRSRFGCRNCKLRKLKVSCGVSSFQSTVLDCLNYQCDERKPQCQRCNSFGILCNFISNIPDLQPVAADAGQPFVVQGKEKLQPPLTNAFWTSDASTSFQLNTRCQDFVTRYLGRSLITPDDPNMIQVNAKLLELAFAVRIYITSLIDQTE